MIRRYVELECDRECGSVMWHDTAAKARKEARKDGWYVSASVDLCPDCRPQRAQTNQRTER